jgi:hypothetical protein
MNRTINILSTSRTALILLLATLLTATAAQTTWAADLTITTIDEWKPHVVNADEPVKVNGETLFEPLEKVAEAIKANILPAIALPLAADSRATVSADGALTFSQGADLSIALLGLKLHGLVRFVFTGRMFGDSSKLRSTGSGTRAAGDLELVSGVTYEVMEAGDLMLTLKTSEAAFTLKSIITSNPTSPTVTGIETAGTIQSGSGSWYTPDGRRLSGKPTKKGLYINNGRKVVIK